MSITFNAFEIFEMAEQIERNGVKFYRKAAEIFSDRDISRTLLEFADMEAEHEETFADMRKQLSSKQRELIAFDPENEMALYLQAMAGGHVFDLKKDMSLQLTGEESVEDVLNMAIQAEKDSIVFYLGIKEAVDKSLGQGRIDHIIKEEMGHIKLLSDKLVQYKE